MVVGFTMVNGWFIKSIWLESSWTRKKIKVIPTLHLKKVGENKKMSIKEREKKWKNNTTRDKCRKASHLQKGTRSWKRKGGWICLGKCKRHVEAFISFKVALSSDQITNVHCWGFGALLLLLPLLLLFFVFFSNTHWMRVFFSWWCPVASYTLHLLPCFLQRFFPFLEKKKKTKK